jgi:signal transduction histidine kinase
VLRNLLVNALKYSPTVPGSPSRWSACRLRRQPGNTDHRGRQGPGVPPEALERIFERFYRVDPSRNRNRAGAGSDSPSCKRIVESSGGCMGAYRRDPSGLAVWFELPEA